MSQFWERVAKSDGCWLWTGAKHRQGYGSLRRGTKSLLAHRVAWIEANGPIPNGLHVLHRCDVTACVRPDHLFLGTHADNMRDRQEKGRTVIPPTQRGDACSWSKLKSHEAALIRHLTDCGVRQRLLAKLFNVNQVTVSLIHRRINWAHVPDLKVPEMLS